MLTALEVQLKTQMFTESSCKPEPRLSLRLRLPVARAADGMNPSNLLSESKPAQRADQEAFAHNVKAPAPSSR
jgi:hypothetical protein